MNLLVFFSLLTALRRLRQKDRWTRPQLEVHQANSLLSLRKYAYAHSPFYQKFHRGLEHRPLSELPVLTKAMMMQNFDTLVTDRAVHLTDVMQHRDTLQGDEVFLNRYRVNATSGSTGRPGLFLYDQSEWVLALASFIRAYQWLEGATYLPPRMKIATVVSPTSWHMSRRAGATLETRWAKVLRLYANEPVDSLVKRLNAHEPDLLGAYPSVARMLASEQQAGRLRIAPRYIFTGAEALPEETRRRIEEAWGAGRLFDLYGVTEAGTIAAECTEHSGLHLFEDLAIFEVVDENNQPVPPGVYGEKLLITVLFNRTQPLIRYELSDSVRLAGKPCPCGRAFSLITDVRGRTEDILRFQTKAGKEIALNSAVIDQVLDTVPAGEWQVVQETDHLDILLCGTPADFPDERLAQGLRQALAAEGVLVPRIVIRHVPAIPRGATGKAPLIKSNLPRA